MATLTTLKANGDGTISADIERNDAGSPIYNGLDDDADGLSSDYVTNIADADGQYDAWFALSNVDADFDSMATLNITLDGAADGSFTNDTCVITARIADADAGTTWLTDETATILDQADTTRGQPNVSFAGLTGTKTQWDGAYVRIRWDYNRNASPDGGAIWIYGMEIDGTYNVAGSGAGIPIVMNHRKLMAGN